MAGIMEGFGGFASAAVLGKLALYFFIFLLIGGSITALIIAILVRKKSSKVIEINMVNKRIRTFTGRVKKERKGGVKKLWIGRLKKYLPVVQQKSVFLKGNQDCIILLKDNNELRHTARIPTYLQLKKWYKIVHNIDLTEEKWKKEGDKLKDIYLLPSPHEDLDWLAGQNSDADKEFISGHWWQSPTVAILGTAFICFLMVIMTMIIEKKFG